MPTLLEAGVGAGITSGISGITSIFTTHVVPMLTTEPFNYFLGASLLGLGIGVFVKFRHGIH